MHLIRAATLSVSDLDHSRSVFCEWLDYESIENGAITTDLARSWGADESAGARYTLLRPASHEPVYLRLIEQDIHPDYKPLRSFGWAAIEICNQDTLAVNERMEKSPFEIIGPPKQLDGMPAIFPMQVKGPDGEIIYLTEIRDNMEEYDLPRAKSLIDRLFILVMACADMEETGAWLEKHLQITKGRSMEIIYTMINKAFDLPMDTKHPLATLKHGRDVFLEIDTYPKQAITRPQFAAQLPPGVSIGSFMHPEFDKLDEINKDHWIRPPAIYDSAVYAGKRSATMKSPDGTLIEVIEA